MQSQPHHERCCLSIAGIAVAIACDNEQLIAALRQRFAAFAAAGSAQLTIDVRVRGNGRSTPLFDPQIRFESGVARFASDGYTGEIDVERGVTWLELSTTHPLEEIEYAVRVAYALLVFRAGGLLFHAAGIARREQGYLFFGYSGSGKTTVSRLSPNDLILNDDLIVLLPERDGWIAHATPFSNPTQIKPTRAASAPVRALLRLVQSPRVAVEPLGGAQALAEVIASCPVVSGDPAHSTALLARCLDLLRAVPCYRLHFLPDDSFWPHVEALIVE